MELFSKATEPYLYLARVALLENQSNIAWEYLEKLPAADLTNWDYNYLHDEPDFEPLRKFPKWKALMKNYFPEQMKE